MSLTITTGGNSRAPLLGLLIDALATGVNPDMKPGAAPAQPLPSGALSLSEWQAKFGGGVVDKPLGAHHRRAWDWFEGLTPGVKPPALIECWSRGHGKSTTAEAGVSRVCATASRRFVLYASGTQEAADRHIQSIASLLERQGVERAVNKFGFSRGWRGSMLRTANGFNVLAFGLDAGARGVKLDELRPDLIILDDIDERHDSSDVAAKKAEIVAQTLLPAGSSDCAILFVQNRISSYGVMATTLNRENGILLRRVPTEPIPAVEGLVYEQVIDADGAPLYQITSGTPTWDGKPLSVCQDEINEYGIVSFRRECQHETGIGTTFFEEFDKARHTCPPPFTPDNPPPAWANVFAGLDWGFRDPFAFVLCAADTSGAVHVIESFQRAGLKNPEQAQMICDTLAKWGIAKDRCKIAYDPSMDAKHTARMQPGFVGEADIEAFRRAGLRCVKADNNRQAGWSQVRNFLWGKTREGRPLLRIWQGFNVDLVSMLGLAQFDRDNVEDMAEGSWDHLNDALRYSLMTRVKPSNVPKAVRADNLPFALQNGAEDGAGAYE